MKVRLWNDVQRFLITAELLQDLNEVLVNADEDKSNAVVVSLLNKKMQGLIEKYDIFEMFKNCEAFNVKEYVEGIKAEGALEEKDFTLHDYLELKSNYGMEKLGILDPGWSINPRVDKDDLICLYHIFKKLAFIDEVSAGGN